MPFASPVVPSPSWPNEAPPQHHTVLSVRTAHVWLPPADIIETPGLAATVGAPPVTDVASARPTTSTSARARTRTSLRIGLTSMIAIAFTGMSP
jgi:hypothetical protein